MAQGLRLTGRLDARARVGGVASTYVSLVGQVCWDPDGVCMLPVYWAAGEARTCWHWADKLKLARATCDGPCAMCHFACVRSAAWCVGLRHGRTCAGWVWYVLVRAAGMQFECVRVNRTNEPPYLDSRVHNADTATVYDFSLIDTRGTQLQLQLLVCPGFKL